MDTNRNGSSRAWRSGLNSLASARAALEGIGPSDGPILTVAIPHNHCGTWSAQTTLLRSVAVSMQRSGHIHARVIVLNLSGQQGIDALSPDVRELIVDVDRDVWQSDTGRNSVLETLGVDCLLSLAWPLPSVSQLGVVGWIADFQHFRMPQFFPAEELASRDKAFHDIIDRCDRVLLSSRDAERDCLRFRPDSAGKTRVNSFPSGLIFQNLSSSAGGAILQKYHLPEKFILVANQFWAHKNHLTIIEGARLLAERGLRIPFVLTGLPSDYRDPANSLVSKMLQAIASGGVRDCVIPLAQVPYADLIALLRHAALVVQPSSFEGWSTTVQDAKALGRPVACSSISLHREQAPNAVGFFGPTRPDEFADLITREWEGLSPGPNPHHEESALDVERSFAHGYGETLWQICAEAASLHKVPVR